MFLQATGTEIKDLSQLEKLWSSFVSWLLDILPNLISAIVVLVVGWWLATLLSKLVRRGMERGKLDGGIVSFVHSITKNTLRIIVLISAAAQLGLNVTSLIAALGAAGVTAGLALKDSLSNVASGALIIINKPFRVGDYLEVENLQGTVKRIEMMFTTLNTFDNKEIIIPNSRLTANNIVNFTAQATRRLDLTYSVSYSDNLMQVKALLQKMVDENDLILREPEPLVAIGEHKASGIDVVVKVWCASENYWTLYYQMQEKVKLAFDENGITIPFDQLDVHIAPQQ